MADASAKPILCGLLATLILLGVYFSVLSLVSGSAYALAQFSDFRYFIISLAIGFGVQVGLYAYLKQSIQGGGGTGKMLSVTGTTSTVAMISCCSHYLVNLLPILGTVGIITLVAEYQVKLFWVGLLFNFVGIVYIGNKIFKLKEL